LWIRLYENLAGFGGTTFNLSLIALQQSGAQCRPPFAASLKNTRPQMLLRFLSCVHTLSITVENTSEQEEDRFDSEPISDPRPSAIPAARYELLLVPLVS
jgi:hypothetical protein